MKIIVIGGVAAGTKAAAKLKREDRSAQVEIYTKSTDISYAGCGLPYFVGGDIASREELIVNSPEKFASLTGAAVHTGREAVGVDPAAKTVTFRSADGSTETVGYDKLIIATGATPIVPNIEGVGLKGVFTVRTPDDAVAIRDYIEKNDCKKAVVVGAGFIGMEMAENLTARKLSVTVVDMLPQILPGILDPEMAGFAARELRKGGMKLLTGVAVSAIRGESAVSAVATSAGELAADLVVLSIGVRPATAFLTGTGIEMDRGAIVVDEYQKTSLDDIYAAGDCALVRNRVTGAPQWSAMGSTANLTARCLAKTLTGTPSAYAGCLGTGVVRLSDTLSAGRTGLSEEQAVKAGYEVVTAVCVTDDKAHYYPDASTFVTKLIADKNTGKLLGMQVLGGGAVDKMTDIAVVGISAGLKVGDFDTMDLAYAPPFSTAIHPFVQACYVLQNKLSGALETFTPAEYLAGKAKDYRVIDVQPEAKIFGATWVNLAKVNGELPGIGKEEKLLLVCTRGKRGYFLQNRLKYYGYTNTKVLEGGAFFNAVKVEHPTGTLSAAEIKRVKALGCLWDKRYTDVFNVRVITKNGKITAAEQRIIAEAAEKFGSGEVTMTSRLTLEIQGVHYADIADLIAYLNENGLITGGTGSLVRPVVSCKGTTCQYGLIDTLGLSEKIHERFYLGYHDVTLPHKFKIAVGGCPNNCVKPDLNDLGIIGQRVPAVEPDKCRGCKKCHIENNCPIKAAKVVDGKLIIGTDCNNCGRCKGKCPFGALPEYTDGYKIYIGGRWGKKFANGRPLEKIFTSEEEVMDVVERAILFFRDEGLTGERFADTIRRLGFDYVQDKLLSSEIDKTAILNKTVKGGATC